MSKKLPDRPLRRLWYIGQLIVRLVFLLFATLFFGLAIYLWCFFELRVPRITWRHLHAFILIGPISFMILAAIVINVWETLFYCEVLLETKG